MYKNLTFNPNYSESGTATADWSSYDSWANSNKYRSWNTIADLSKWYGEDWERFKTEYSNLIINYSNLGYDWNWSLIAGSHSNENLALNLKDISPTEEGTKISELSWSDSSGMAYANITLTIWIRIIPETMELQFRTYGFMEIKVISAPLDRISGTMAINSVKFE
ncbi:hypothetical protein [Spiroplasma sp. DGKH1]|uniref:hypothetical protein n=1 Tax=Spiroplasma sp. DGKH1 TaxID=3050074 RepID=UPI0034C6C37F